MSTQAAMSQCRQRAPISASCPLTLVQRQPRLQLRQCAQLARPQPEAVQHLGNLGHNHRLSHRQALTGKESADLWVRGLAH